MCFPAQTQQARFWRCCASALSGEIAKARGRYGEAVLAFEQAVRLQDALNFNEPPDWVHSMRLYLGAALLKAGRPKDAEGVYREELRDLRDNGWALFGLWQSVRSQGRSAEAQKIRERFERAWKRRRCRPERVSILIAGKSASGQSRFANTAPRRQAGARDRAHLPTANAYYWRTHAGAELDLLLFLKGRRIGIEIKRADAPKMTPPMAELALR